jgi:hypothetical protein
LRFGRRGIIKKERSGDEQSLFLIIPISTE